MDFFLKAEDRKLVKELNLAMGTRYRTTPYDLNDPDDFAQALAMITAEYIDFLYYWSEVDDVMDPRLKPWACGGTREPCHDQPQPGP